MDARTIQQRVVTSRKANVTSVEKQDIYRVFAKSIILKSGKKATEKTARTQWVGIPEESEMTQDLALFSIGEKHSKNPTQVTILDTGALLSVISKGDTDALFPAVRLKSSQVALRTYVHGRANEGIERNRNINIRTIIKIRIWNCH